MADNVTSTLLERMGIVLHYVTANSATGSMPVAGNTQPQGLLHGGASAVLAETLASAAAATHAGPGRRAVGIELSISHHRSVTTGSVTGRATAVRLGEQLAAYEIAITNQDGQRVASARLTAMIID